jgi:hypothetical protein
VAEQVPDRTETEKTEETEMDQAPAPEYGTYGYGDPEATTTLEEPAQAPEATRTSGTPTTTGTSADEPSALPESRPAERRTPDPLTLVAGLVALAAAVMVLTGWVPEISFDPRWVLAGGAVALGALLLVSSMRKPR